MGDDCYELYQGFVTILENVTLASATPGIEFVMLKTTDLH